VQHLDEQLPAASLSGYCGLMDGSIQGSDQHNRRLDDDLVLEPAGEGSGSALVRASDDA
jgi:hypothetical protein